MVERVVVVTNVTEYAGAPSAAGLAADGFRVLCHDPGFGDAAARAAYEQANPGQIAAEATTPEVIEALAGLAATERATLLGSLSALFAVADRTGLRAAILRLAYLDKFAEEARARRFNMVTARR